jgi:hypothetical protein
VAIETAAAAPEPQPAAEAAASPAAATDAAAQPSAEPAAPAAAQGPAAPVTKAPATKAAAAPAAPATKAPAAAAAPAKAPATKASASGEFVDGPGKAALQTSCTNCHEASLVTSVRKSQSEWEATVEKMIGYGAPVSDAEFKTIVAYLTRHYGS